MVSKQVTKVASGIAAGQLLQTSGPQAVATRLGLPGIGESTFGTGERLVSRAVYENYIQGQRAFRLGKPGDASFFFNRSGANPGSSSLEAAISAGFTRGDIQHVVSSGGNELFRLRFRLDKFSEISVPGVSEFPSGLGRAPIPGAGPLFTGNGRTRTLTDTPGIDEFIANNIELTPQDLEEVKSLGRIERIN